MQYAKKKKMFPIKVKMYVVTIEGMQKSVLS